MVVMVSTLSISLSSLSLSAPPAYLHHAETKHNLGYQSEGGTRFRRRREARREGSSRARAKVKGREVPPKDGHSKKEKRKYAGYAEESTVDEEGVGVIEAEKRTRGEGSPDDDRSLAFLLAAHPGLSLSRFERGELIR